MPHSSFEKNIQQYAPTDDAQFSNKDLTRAYWFATHKVLLRNIGIIFLLLIDVMLIGYAVFGLVNYVFVGNARERDGVIASATAIVRDTSARLSASAPKPLVTGDTQLFSGADNRYDFVAPIENPNSQWLVEVTYSFSVESVPEAPASAQHTALLLPNEKKFLTELSRVFPDGAPQTPTVTLIAQQWRRIDTHEIPDAAAFMQARHTFEITDAQFIPAGLADASGTAVAGNKILFTIKNATAYNFVEVPVQIVLLQAGSLVGFEETIIKKLQTGETRTIDVRSYSTQSADEVQVIPSVNIFDAGVYSEQ